MTRRRRSRRPRITSLGTLVIVLLLGALYLVFERQGAAEPVPPQEMASPEGWVAVWFTDPTSLTADTLRGGPDEQLANAIDAAQSTVDMAIYDFDLWSLRDSLIEAAQRGVAIRVVTDSDNILSPEIEELEGVGIEVAGDRRAPLMHHKFVVIDGGEVWTGSMNFTVNGAYRNNNNLIRVRSSRLSENYTREFEEMYLGDNFGALSEPDTPNPLVSIDGVEVETLFSPDDGVAERIIELIEGAASSIEFLAFSFTSDDIAGAMIDQAAEGIVVRGIFDAAQGSGQGSEFDRLRAAGLDVRKDGMVGTMHHKVILIDGSTVITGSYNFSASAEERNDENVLIIHDTELAGLYGREFERLFAAALPFR